MPPGRPVECVGSFTRSFLVWFGSKVDQYRVVTMCMVVLGCSGSTRLLPPPPVLPPFQEGGPCPPLVQERVVDGTWSISMVGFDEGHCIAGSSNAAAVMCEVYIGSIYSDLGRYVLCYVRLARSANRASLAFGRCRCRRQRDLRRGRLPPRQSISACHHGPSLLGRAVLRL